jgi:hypothetical protein
MYIKNNNIFDFCYSSRKVLMKKLLVVLPLILLFSCSKNKPMKLHFISDEKQVLYYGSAHCNDILNPMFADIEKSFMEFNPEVILIEGGYHSNNYYSMESAIEKGEMAFASYLGLLTGIPRMNIEPSEKYVDSLLLIRYNKEQVFAMYVLRQTFQLINEIKYSERDIEQQIVDYANQVSDRINLDAGNPFSFREVFTIIEKVSALVITPHNWKEREVEIRNCIYKRGSIINRIHSEVVGIRDQYAVNLIIKHMHEYDKIFVIMGNQHLINQKKDLRRKINEFF